MKLSSSLPPHATAKQSVSGRCRGSRGSRLAAETGGQGTRALQHAAASELHHSNTPRGKTKHKTPHLPGLYKKLKVKEEQNNVVLGEEEEILSFPHNTRCVLPFHNFPSITSRGGVIHLCGPKPGRGRKGPGALPGGAGLCCVCKHALVLIVCALLQIYIITQ